MPVKIKCSGCDKVLSVPDAARGKAVKCPACQTRIAVPAESPAKKPAAAKAEGSKGGAGSKTKKPARAHDSEEALLAFDMRRAEDKDARVCPKCGFDMKWQDEEDNECPQCGFDTSVGGMGVKAKKKSMKGPDPADFYPRLAAEGWKFVRKNMSIAIRTSIYTLVALTLGLACIYLYFYVYMWPPRIFLAMCAVICLCIIPGWTWVLDVEVLKLVLERKDKFKRLNFDFFLSSAMGLAFVGWCFVFVLPLMLIPTALGFVFVRAMEGQPEIVFPITVGVALLPVISMLPVVMAHMAMPVPYRGWMIWTIVPTWAKNIKPLLYWLLFFVLTNIPTIAGLTTITVMYGPAVQRAIVSLEKNADINRQLFYARENPNAKKKGQKVKEMPKVEELQQVDFSQFIVPAAVLGGLSLLHGFIGLFNMRTHAQFVYYNKASLNLIDKRKEYKYVAKSPEDLLDDELKPKTTQQLITDSVAFFLVFGLIGAIGGMVYGFSTTFGMLGGILYGLDFGLGLAWLVVNKECVHAAYKEGIHSGLIVNFIPFGSIWFIMQNLEERKSHLIKIVVGWIASVLIVGLGLILILSEVVTIGPPVSKDHEDATIQLPKDDDQPKPAEGTKPAAEQKGDEKPAAAPAAAGDES